MILDTTFLIDLMKNDIKAINKAKELVKNEVSQIITTPTLFEIWSGIIQSKRKINEEKKIKELLVSQIIFDFDKASSIEAGKIDGELCNKGIKIEPVDSMIAGIAKTKKESILTRNTKHFNRIEGIKILDY
jgi:hypothetical protein